MEYPIGQRGVTITLESFINHYLSGDHEVPLQSAFLAFCDILAHSACQLPRPPLRNAATATPVFCDKNTPLPKPVSVVFRVVDISESRRQGMVHVLWKLVGSGFCRSDREVEKLWKAKDPKEAGDRFLGVAVWAEQTETEIFHKSKHNLSEYQSLLLNVVFGLLRKKDWRGKEVPQSHLTNSAAQTQDSFIQQRQRSAKEILNHKRPKNLTKREFDVLREQNKLLERKARRRRRLELRHSYTQTSASLRDGLKSLESESSGGFSWLDLAPSPLRFFPMLWVATQTDDRQIGNTKKIVANGKIKLQMKLPKGKRNPLEPVLDFVIQNWDRKVGIAPRGAHGMAPSTETALGLRMAHFVQLLLKTPNLELGRCPNHWSGLKAGCPFCTAAIKAPPPWADVMFQLLLEVFTGSSANNPTDGVHFLFLSKRAIEKDDPFLGAQPPWSLLVHLLRQLFLDCGAYFDSNTRKRMDFKEFRAESLDCGCFILKMVEQLIEQDSRFGIPEKMSIILNKMLAIRVHPSHMCIRCGKLELESSEKFRVCCECRRQRLMVKAHYCSLDCLLKDWHKHHKLHDALAPGKTPSVGCAVMLFSSAMQAYPKHL